MTRPRADCPPLLAVATPRIYRRNLFRVLGLPADATPRDVHRQQARRRMQEKLGMAPADTPFGLLALEPPPSEDDRRAAMERLNRPVDRLLDEVFWFWPTNGSAAADPALRALAQGQLKAAADLWMDQARHNGSGQIATHNLAVLEHVIALDYEARLATEDLDKKQRKYLADLWSRAFARWKEVLAGETFWSLVKQRVRALDDVQLTTGFVRRIRQALPIALLLINAKIAYDAAERGDAALARRHTQLLREAGFPDGLAEEAILESLKPVRSRIKTATDSARSRWRNAPQYGDRYVRELYEQVRGLLAVLDIILPEDDLTRVGLHDAVSEAMLEGQVTFGHKTNDWQKCIELLGLAQELAVGDALRSRLSENLDILRNNAEAANDWCSPGYWDLPEETVSTLESIRERVEGGDYDGAIRALTVLDPAVGKPLRRCLAYALSLKAVHVGNNALGEFNTESGVIKQIMDRLRGAGESGIALLLGRRPDPDTTSFMNPPCLCCGSSSYTRWVNFTYQDIPLFMCSSCSARHDRQLKQRKSKLREQLRIALEYMQLANEVDPGDPGVERNLETLKGTAREINCRIPGTADLKKSLGAKMVHSAHRTFEPAAEDSTCHFCGQGAADEACGISVPMCGDVQSVQLLFGKGTEYSHGTMIVPRCRRCRDEHRELPVRLARWREARSAASSDEHFPDEASEAATAAPAAESALAVVEGGKKKLGRAQKALAAAESAGSRCTRCHSSASWEEHVCRRCDAELFKLPEKDRGAVVGAVFVALVGSALLLFLSWVFWVVVVLVPILVGVLTASHLKDRLREHRQEIGAERAAKFQEQRRLAPRYRKVAKEIRATVRVAAERAKAKVEAHQRAQEKLRAAKRRAVEDFCRIYPRPQLTAGVKPETTFAEFTRISKLREQGWWYGSKLDEGSLSGSDDPIDVQGLVGADVAERGVVHCPACNKRLRVPLSDKLVKARCSCGRTFLLRDGSVQPPGTSAAKSSKPLTGRERIKAMAREAGPENEIQCPLCHTRMKAKSLIRHYDKSHQGADVPASAVGGTAGTATAPRRARQSGASRDESDRCPHCGFTYKWNGSSCGHCGYGR